MIQYEQTAIEFPIPPSEPLIGRARGGPSPTKNKRAAVSRGLADRVVRFTDPSIDC